MEREVQVHASFIYSEREGDFKLSQSHPYQPSRIRHTFELCKRYGLFSRPEVEVVSPPPAELEEMAEVHDRQYLNVLKMEGKGATVTDFLAHGLGTEDCPMFKGLWELCRIASGATLEAGRRVIDQGRRFAFNPFGGYHHAFPDHAEGFCYVNDICLLAKRLADRGLKVLVVDIDAHHGNGTQAFFYEDPRVLTMSFHESGETLYPWGGGSDEIGAGKGVGYNINVPLPAGCDDEVFLYAFKDIFPPVIKAFAPDLTIGVMGVDSFATDPLTHLKLTNNGYIQAAKIIDRLAPRWIALGAGGYDLENVTKGWTLLWAEINGLIEDDFATAMVGGAFMGDAGIGVAGLRDRASRISGPEKATAVKSTDSTIHQIMATVFPLIGAKP